MKFTRISIRTTPSGHELSIPVYFFKGKNPKAKKAYLQSSIHGAEHQGNAVIFHLIEFFKKKQPLGDVTLVPVCNPAGLDRKAGEYTDGRFDPATGENWNRFYLDTKPENLKGKLDIPALKNEMLNAVRKKLKTPLRFAEKQALTLQSMAITADIVLDLHNANVSLPYVYASNACLEDAVYLGFKNILSIPPVFGGALDEAISAPWAKLISKHGLKEADLPQGYTIELGGQERLSLADGKQEASQILDFLRRKKVVSGVPKKPLPCRICDLDDYETIYAPKGGLYDYHVQTGEVVKKGTVLASRLNFGPKGGVLTEIKAEKDCVVTLRYSSSAVNEGDELFKIFSKWRNISTT